MCLCPLGNTGSVFKSCDVIFEKSSIHFTTQPIPTIFDNNPFPYKNNGQQPHIKEEYGETTEVITQEDIIGPLPQGIAPKPLPIPEVYRENSMSTTNNKTKPTNTLSMDHRSTNDLLLAIRQTHQEPKPSSWLRESYKYLNRPHIFLADTKTWVPRTYYEAMRQPELWWEPMVKKYEMLKE